MLRMATTGTATTPTDGIKRGFSVDSDVKHISVLLPTLPAKVPLIIRPYLTNEQDNYPQHFI